MKRIGLFIGFLAVLAFLLPALTAEDAKKTEKTEAEKKDDKKDPEKKDPEKKDTAKKPDAPKKEKFVYGYKFPAKILGFKGNSTREVTVEVRQPDPQKVADMNNWASQRQGQLGQQYANIFKTKDANQRAQQLVQWNKDTANFMNEYANRQNNVYTTKSVEISAHETAKVRSMIPPVEFDDQGFQKKWTKKELDERKDKIGWPGHFPLDFDALKQGQYVDVYMAKITPMKKKGPDDDPAPMKDKKEFVLIVIKGAEAAK